MGVNGTWTQGTHGSVIGVNMFRLLLFIFTFGKIRMSRDQEVAGSEALTHYATTAPFRGVVVVSLRIVRQLPNHAAHRKGVLRFVVMPYEPDTKPPHLRKQAGGVAQQGALVMQHDSLPDPRIKRAYEYLRRIRRHCRSEHAAIYESWIDNTPAEHLEVEVTTKNLHVVCAIAHAIQVLGGTLIQFTVSRLYFCNDERLERHTVAVVRFRLD